jgi:peptidoglycan LD-endopeptidase LytH
MSSAVRRVGVLFIGAALLLTTAIGPSQAAAGLEPDREAAERAAREIAAARERANDAAEEFFAAESRLELLELEQGRLEVELAELAQTVADLKAAVEFVAVNRFVASGASGIPILTDLREPTEQLHGDVLAEVVAESGATTLDDYDEARAALDSKRDELDENERALEQQQDELVELQADAEAEVERLREIESQRLQDEAVQIALLAQQREDARQLAELERRRAEAARAEADAGQAVAAALSAASSDSETTGNQGASGGAAGGRTGGGGAGTNPRAAGSGYVDSIICPVQGTSAYGDTWGSPRSGGRRHQGTDMLAPTGTPLQAVVGGTVAHRSNALGGITLSLLGDNGNRYYYAHLSGYEGIPGRVEQGQVIGYVGDTGNATGVPHLHFEIRPGGGVPVNPYPSVRAAGC